MILEDHLAGLLCSVRQGVISPHRALTQSLLLVRDGMSLALKLGDVIDQVVYESFYLGNFQLQRLRDLRFLLSLNDLLGLTVKAFDLSVVKTLVL